MTEPQISVGILSAQKINFTLLESFQYEKEELAKGDYSARISDGKIDFNGNLHSEVIIEAKDIHSSSFELKDVVIGINFHWERKEDQ